GQVEALPARVDGFLDGAKGVGKGQHLAVLGGQQVVRQPFGGLRADAGQLGQFVRQPGDGIQGLLIHAHTCWRFVLPSHPSTEEKGKIITTSPEGSSRPAAPSRTPSWWFPRPP